MALKARKSRLAAALDEILDTINGIPAPGYIEIYEGTLPAEVEDAVAGDLLSTCVLVDGTVDAFASTPSTSPLTAVGYTDAGVWAADGDIVATGTAGCFRLFDSSDVEILQGTVGTSGADLILDSVALVQHGTVTITQFDITIA